MDEKSRSSGCMESLSKNIARIMEEEYTLDCPYCGEPIDILLDVSAGSQEYVEDCQVCCQPILLNVEVDYDGQLLSVTGKTNDEG